MFIAFFWARQNGELNTIERIVNTKEEAETIARDQGWRLVGVEKNTPEFQEALRRDKQKASIQILHFEAVKSGRKKWWEPV